MLPNGISQKKLADHIGCDVKVINRIVNERTILTTSMAVKLASAFNTSPEFWLNAQMAIDLYNVTMNFENDISNILKNAS